MSTVVSDINWLLGIAGAIGTVVGVLEKTQVWAAFGLSAAAAIWIAAAIAALITIGVVFDFYRLRCLANPDTQAACSAGVIQTVVPAFNSAADELFPFTAMHDRIDVVVKCAYWFRVETNAGFVFCNVDPDLSPILRGYYKSDRVCGAGLGSTIGAVVGGVAGIFLGVLAGGAIASIACGPFAWLCLIIAVIVAVLVAVACVLVSAFVGGQIGKAAAGGSGPTTDTGSTLNVMDYVTTSGGLLSSGEDQGARVYWFVTSTTQHGQSANPPPYSHADPDTVLTIDACG